MTVQPKFMDEFLHRQDMLEAQRRAEQQARELARLNKYDAPVYRDQPPARALPPNRPQDGAKSAPKNRSKLLLLC